MLHAEDVASIIVARSPGLVGRMKLLKLLYYVQAWHLAITDECAYPEKTKAWVEGPVVPQVWHAFKDPETRRPANQNVATLEVSHMLSSVIDAVQATYGHMTGNQLSQLTHDELPWVEARAERPASEPCSDEVSVETMARFHRTHNLLAGQTAADIAAGGFLVQEASEAAFDVDAFLATLDTKTFPEQMPWDDSDSYEPPADFQRYSQRATA